MPIITTSIAARFNGPPGSGNGGYVCGLIAQALGGTAEVTLRAPPPLDTPLTLELDGARAALRDGETLLAEAHRASLAIEPPAAPSLAQAQAAAARYPGLVAHSFSTCFVCGPGRPHQDGLHIYTGPVEGRDIVAAPWTPSADLAGEDGRVREIFVHAALDCPSYWALAHAGRPALLARMVVRIDGPLPEAGAPLIVVGWALNSEGRKHRGASALFTPEGECIACAEALWIEPKSLQALRA